ncbi:MAG: hypothetical protein AUJ52_11880 [Elusimicrobia bacterium CG1_02_63_36]|nr:MAG: hypothetical protein AUJ52_11880 [Elusimicrobia bacterium CG1_02_63_36]PIP83759.1 MAG: hypothetical protein COR54_07865 [Elusimicrobia bacterium CG22_combo_CG10-13_8_21_14_all_63_91]PJA12024.1 MAG: hypothetical protein COX66_18275 [Elusimicrobia bacterium CG_4_10_14_0_2_um_filter_63_34]PJB25924.1 MAG: hypothetical protein CO113_06120 [Elusimicrobia bacterium CG_4_9_14_3_um_filter_62_55]
MAQNNNPDPATEEDAIKDRPAASLLKSWGKRMSQGGVCAIPVFIGGKWSIAVPRGNKRVLQLAIDNPAGKSN